MPMSLSFARTGNNRALITDRRPVQHRPQTTTDAACTSSPTHERSTRRRQTETHAHAVGVRWVWPCYLAFSARRYFETRSKQSRQWRESRVLSVWSQSARNHACLRSHMTLLAFSAGPYTRRPASRRRLGPRRSRLSGRSRRSRRTCSCVVRVACAGLWGSRRA